MSRVIRGDAFAELPKLGLQAAVATSLPDQTEIGMNWRTYSGWLLDAAALCLAATHPRGVCLFYQTDRKEEGQWRPKAAQITGLAVERGYKLLWHKIALRREPMVVDLYRPSYASILAFSAEGRVGKPVPDVIWTGSTMHTYGMGVNAAALMASYALTFQRATGDLGICDPFCGWGTMLRAAQAAGWDGQQVTGIDISAECCARAAE